MNLLSLVYFYNYFSIRLSDLSNISEINYFIIVSPFILGAIFCCINIQYYDTKRSLKIYEKYILFFFFWIGSLFLINFMYGLHFAIISNYINSLDNWIYAFCLIAVFLTISVVKINKKSSILFISSYYFMEWILFLKTIDVIKRRWIDPNYFFDPYIKVLIITIAIGLIVAAFINFLRSREEYCIQLRQQA